MKNHPDEGLLVSYLDGQLGWFHQWKIRLHLWRCPGCPHALAELGKGLRHLPAAEDVPRSETLNAIRTRLLHSIQEEQKQPLGYRVQGINEIRFCLGSQAA